MNTISAFCVRVVRATNYIFQQKAFQHPQLFSAINVFHSPQNVRHVSAPSKLEIDLTSPLTPEEEIKLKVLKKEYEIFEATGVNVPKTMTDKDWLTVLRRHTGVNGRKNYYKFLFLNEIKDIKRKEKSLKLVQEKEEKKAKVDELRKAGLIENFKNSFMLFLIEETINKFQYANIFWGMANGAQSIVFDFSFEQHMMHKEHTDLIKQILTCHGLNKMSREPYHLHFCNLPKDSFTYKKLDPNMNLESMPLTVSSGSYLDHYPKEKLVYLCPNAPNDLNEYSHDDVYIIGSLVDKVNEVPLTLAKIKKEGIRMAKLPLDKSVKWVQGTKALPLNQVLEIMLRVKNNSPWHEAIVQSLPRRKFMEVSQEARELEEKERASKMKYRTEKYKKPYRDYNSSHDDQPRYKKKQRD